MSKILNFIVTRLSERSTWLGLTGLLTVVGVSLAPEQLDAIITVGIGIASAIGVFTADKATSTTTTTNTTVVVPPAEIVKDQSGVVGIIAALIIALVAGSAITVTEPGVYKFTKNEILHQGDPNYEVPANPHPSKNR